MLTNIKEIGKMVRTTSEEDFVSNLVEYDEDLMIDEKENRKFLVIMDFDLESKKLNLYRKEVDRQVLEEYLWVGNAKGNNPQDRLTTNNVSYLIGSAGAGSGSSVINLLNNLKDGTLKNLLKEVKDEFFISLPLERARYCLDLGKIGNGETIEIIAPENGDEKKYLKDIESFWKLLRGN